MSILTTMPRSQPVEGQTAIKPQVSSFEAGQPLAHSTTTASLLADFELVALGLDQAGVALMILDCDGAIRHLNPAAQEMLRRSPILHLRQNRLHIRHGDEATAMRQSIGHIGTPATPSAAAMPAIVNLRDREGCVVASMLMRSLTPRGLTGAIILRVADFTSRPASDPAWIVNIFGLTPAESKVANGLLEGLSIADIAAREGNAVETVRGHVKRAMAKVSVRSQAQFVSMLMRAHAALVNPDVGSPLGAHTFASGKKSP